MGACSSTGAAAVGEPSPSLGPVSSGLGGGGGAGFSSSGVGGAGDGSRAKPPPTSILASSSSKAARPPRPPAAKYIAASSPPASPATLATSDVRVVPALAGLPPSSAFHNAAAVPMPSGPLSEREFLRGGGGGSSLAPTPVSPPIKPSREGRRRTNNRRSSDGRRVTGDAHVSGALAGVAAEAGGGGGGGGGGRRHISGRRHTKRRASTNGMMSRLALQFPLIRTSFFAVYRAFARYMAIVAAAEAEVKRKSLLPGQHILLTTSSSASDSSVASAPGCGGNGGGATHQTTVVASSPTITATVPSDRAVLTKMGTESRLLASGPQRAAHDIQLVEAEGGAVTDVATVTEEEARAAEIATLLAHSEPLLEAAPLHSSTVTAATITTISLDGTGGGGIVTTSEPNVSEEDAMSLSSVRVRALGTLTPAKLGEALYAISGGGGNASGRGNNNNNNTSGSVGTPRLSAEELARIFRLSDLDHSKSISFREFLVAAALGYFLRDDIAADAAERANKMKEKENSSIITSTATTQHHVGFHTPAASLSLPGLASLSMPPPTGPVHISQHSPRRLAALSSAQPEAPRPPVSPRRLALNTEAGLTTATGVSATTPVSTVARGTSPRGGAFTFVQPAPAAPVAAAATTLTVPNTGRPGHRSANSLSSLAVPTSTSPSPPAILRPSSASLSGRSTGGHNLSATSSNATAAAAAATTTTSNNTTNSVNTANARNPHFLEVQRGFRVVFHAFREMDLDLSGGVDLAELKRALFAATTLKSDAALLEHRFRELDFDASGEVSLSEFLYGVVSWVGLMDEDDVDEVAAR